MALTLTFLVEVDQILRLLWVFRYKLFAAITVSQSVEKKNNCIVPDFYFHVMAHRGPSDLYKEVKMI